MKTRGTLWRQLLPLAVMFVAVGLSTSFVGPFLALFLNRAVHASPLKTTIFLVAVPISGIVVSQIVGRVSDGRPIRRKLMIVAAIAGIAATAITAVVRDYWGLLAAAVTLNALAGSLFPQSFAYARQVLNRHDPARAAMGISTLRTLFSVAWVGGPPLATLLLAEDNFARTYGSAAVMYTVTAVVAIFWLRELPAATSAAKSADHPEEAPPISRRTIAMIIAAFSITQTAMTLGVQAMPLYVSTQLGGTVRDAGLVLGLCAALEIPLMLGFGALSTRIPLRTLILGGVACAVVYQSLAFAATTVWMIAAAQLVNAVVIATVQGLGISYVQNLLPHQPGRASTLMANTFPVGQMLAAPLFGIAQDHGFRWAYGMNIVLSAVGLVLLFAIKPRRAAASEAVADDHAAVGNA